MALRTLLCELNPIALEGAVLFPRRKYDWDWADQNYSRKRKSCSRRDGVSELAGEDGERQNPWTKW